MKRNLQMTADGSPTLYLPEMDEHYHSVNGALREARHIFIEAGLRALGKERVEILEIGFGTGLNALLTWGEAESEYLRQVTYHSVELYPLEMELVNSLRYGTLVCPDQPGRFEALHEAAWDRMVTLSERFSLHKILGDANTCDLPEQVDLIYLDSFAPEKQPEMWNQSLYDRLFAHTAPGGRIVTYCAKGEVRRGLQTAGYEMCRLPGPPGKRHMLRGMKPA